MKIQITGEHLTRLIPLWAVVFMVAVISFVDLAILGRPEFLLSAVPITAALVISVALAVWRSLHKPGQKPVGQQLEGKEEGGQP